MGNSVMHHIAFGRFLYEISEPNEWVFIGRKVQEMMFDLYFGRTCDFLAKSIYIIH